jgi:mono/diheme cytochrome c family protein
VSKSIERRVWRAALLLVAVLLVAACGSTPEPTSVPAVVEPTQPPSEAATQPSTEAATQPPTEAPTQPPEPTATTAPPPTVKPDPALGQSLWVQKPCAGCHGLTAEGVVGPKLAGTSLSFNQVLLRVRSGKGMMPAFSEADISDQELQHIYAWLRSLAP